jgi:hypothetical protein
MSTRSDERSRAEARRRARLAARGELSDEDENAEEAPETLARGGGGILSRIFPPAPPLPNRPDPLAGFDPSGPLRPVRERIFLLRSNPLAWLVTGVVAFVGFLASIFYAQGLLGLLGTFVLFGSLVAAGWFGWQRPTLFGTAASLVGYLLSAGLIVYTFSSQGAGPDALETTPGQFTLRLVTDGLIQAGLGFLGGWYGGYLRRRQVQVASQTRRRR